MATMAMERPPMPPDVQAQMGGGNGGAPPFAGVGGMMAEKAAAGDPLKTAIDATEKLWTNASKGNPVMEPFVNRALAILRAGLEEVAKQKGGGGAPPPGPTPVPAAPGAGQMPG